MPRTAHDEPRRWLVVGRGATGAVVAHALSRAGVGASVLSLVRTREAGEKAVELLRDGAATVETLTVAWTTSLTAVREFNPHVVVLTLDNVALTSEQGKALLRAIVKETAPDSVFTAAQPGLDTLQTYEEAGVARSRLFHCAFNFLSRDISPESRPNAAAKATFIYRFLIKPTSLFIGESSGHGSVAVQQCLGDAGLEAAGVPASVWAATSHLIFPYFAACGLAGWPAGGPPPELVSLAARAMRETATLHGVAGYALSWLLWGPVVSGAMAFQRKQSGKPGTPLDFDDFGKAHHGIKVGEQNLKVMKQYVAALAAQGKSHDALDELVSRVQRARAGM